MIKNTSFLPHIFYLKPIGIQVKKNIRNLNDFVGKKIGELH